MLFLQINSQLINSFIRLRGSTIHFAEGERVLSKHERYVELVELYNVKGRHEKGLYVCCEIMHIITAYCKMLV